MCVLVACNTTTGAGQKRVVNDAPPSGNAYTLGNWNPNLYFQHYSDARACASARRADCTRAFQFAKRNATSDGQYFDASRDHIAYLMDRKDVVSARRMARDLETTVPGSSFVREFMSANPHPSSEGGLSVGQLIFALGAVYIATGVATNALCERATGGACTGGGAASGASQTTQPTPDTRTTAPRSAQATPSGVKRIENWGTGLGNAPQFKITCHNGTTHLYFRNDGEWWGPFGAAGFSGWSLERLAAHRCGG
ncbi:MAG: hypothetical protein AAGA78_01525 [Pseudomonadota bacterium]